KGVIGKEDATDLLGFPDLFDLLDDRLRRAVPYILPLSAVKLGHLVIETECAVIGAASTGNNNLYRIVVKFRIGGIQLTVRFGKRIQVLTQRPDVVPDNATVRVAKPKVGNRTVTVSCGNGICQFRQCPFSFTSADDIDGCLFDDFREKGRMRAAKDDAAWHRLFHSS